MPICKLVAVAALAIPLTLGLAAGAKAADVDATIKVFNYSKYSVTISGMPVRFSDPSPFSITIDPSSGKGKQLIKTYTYTLSKNGGAGNDIRLQLDVSQPRVASSWKKCLTVLTYGRAEKATTQIGAVALPTGEKVVVGVDAPSYSCGNGNGPDVEFKQSGNDLEFVIDRSGKSWGQ